MVKHRTGRGAKALLLATTASLLLAGTALAQGVQTPRAFDIPAQDAATALQTYARQTGRQVLFRYDLVSGRRTPAIRGQLTDAEALQRLAEAAGLEVTSDDGKTVTLQPRPQSGAQSEATVLDEVVVTGTNIRGANPTAPVHVVTREDIDRSGYGTVGEVIRSLPENFGGGENPGHMAAGSVNQNISNASTVNLRGMGNGATLVLLNGRRLPPNALGQSADISAIPLPAVSRVEVVTDGSSALYGSDAVAGVVNFITKKDYHGLEVSARLGGATQGGAFEQAYSVLGGAARDKWYGLLNVEYAKQDEILPTERDFTSGMPAVATLIWPQERTSAMLSAGANITDRITIDLDALWSDRKSQYTYKARSVSTTQYGKNDASTYSVGTGLRLELPANWTAAVNVSTSQSDVRVLNWTSTVSSPLRIINEVWSFDGSVGGSVFSAPGGPVRVAVGTGFRTDSFDYSSGSVVQNADHEVRYISGEALIPFVGDGNSRAGLRSLELNFSGRFEDYNDYGAKATPKIGLRYKPMTGVSLRGTWGQSFKTPTFAQYATIRRVQIQNAVNFGGAGPGTVLYATGGNLDLKPESSTSWTIGFDYKSSVTSLPEISATYFSMDYDDRVVTPINTTSTSLSNPAFAPFVIRNPSDQQKAALIADATAITNSVGGIYNPNAVVAIVMNRPVNATSQQVSGVDLSVRQEFSFGEVSLKAFANTTWLEIQQRTLPTSSQTQITGSIYNAPAFRARAGLTWSNGALSATGILNYQDGSTDTGVVPGQKIASLTTVDTTLAYRFPEETGPLANLEVTLAASNLFDLDPPYAGSPSALQEGLYFDTVNASPIGRYVSLSVKKRF